MTARVQGRITAIWHMLPRVLRRYCRRARSYKDSAVTSNSGMMYVKSRALGA